VTSTHLRGGNGYNGYDRQAIHSVNDYRSPRVRGDQLQKNTRARNTSGKVAMTVMIIGIGTGIALVFLAIGNLINVFQIEKLHTDIRRSRLRILILEERLDSV